MKKPARCQKNRSFIVCINAYKCFGVFELPEDKKVFAEMIYEARNGIIEDIDYQSDVSVVVQQILSLTMEKHNDDDNKLTRKIIHDLLDVFFHS